MSVAVSGLCDRGPAPAARVFKRLFVVIKGLLASCTMTASEPHRARRSHKAKCFIKTTVVGNRADSDQTLLWLLSALPLAEAKRRAGRPLEGKRERIPPSSSSSGFHVEHLSKVKFRASGSPGQQQARVSEQKPLLGSAPALPCLRLA